MPLAGTAPIMITMTSQNRIFFNDAQPANANE
ncbi:hypothetical protein N824_16790 [Pedobacter sp. V48]|nr:hypothetical protein N824_16790 [Pedobacter sp. V48]